MGPRTTPPPLPDLEGNMQPNADQLVRATQLQCNWLQILEGDIDTTHVGFLHYGGLKAEDQIPGSFSEYQLREKTAHFEVIDTEGGAAYGARRAAGRRARTTGASPSGASRSTRSPRQACSAPRRAATPACRWTTTTP